MLCVALVNLFSVLLLNVLSMRFIHVVTVAVVTSFSLLCSIPLWEYATIYSFILMLIGILVVSRFLFVFCYYKQYYYEYYCTNHWVSIFQSFFGIDKELKFWGFIYIRCVNTLFFERVTNCSPKWLDQFIFPGAMYNISHWSTSFPRLGIVKFLDIYQLSGYKHILLWSW